MEEYIFPKVLIISHNVLSKTSNMGKTMAQFFGKWESENLAQLYFHSEVPNLDLCNKYCRITDFDMLTAVMRCKAKATYFTKNDIQLHIKDTRIDKGFKADIYQLGRKQKPYMYVFRNFIWRGKKWKTRKLMDWIDKFNPDVIFYPAGNYCFSMDIVIDICKERRLPLVTFFGDEYYFLNTNRNTIFDRINKKYYHNSFNELMKHTSFYITASDKMHELYKKEFGGNGCSLLTSTTKAKTPIKNANIKVSYIGNLGLDRWRPLLEIGRVLKKEGIILDIYSSDMEKSLLSYFTVDNGINFCGSISAEEVQVVMSASTLLIHVEAMDEINKEKTRYSMSTKIAESLSSGVCIFAYGPNDIASIEYLKNNNAACVVTSRKELENKLLQVLNDERLRHKYIKNACKLAEKRHNDLVNSEKLYEIITHSCNKS